MKQETPRYIVDKHGRMIPDPRDLLRRCRENRDSIVKEIQWLKLSIEELNDSIGKETDEGKLMDLREKLDWCTGELKFLEPHLEGEENNIRECERLIAEHPELFG